MNEINERLTELEIRLALQDELLAALNDTVAKQSQMLDLQQAQLRLLYSKIQNHTAQDDKPYRLAEEVPPHY